MPDKVQARSSQSLRRILALLALGLAVQMPAALLAKAKEKKDAEGATRTLSRLVLGGQLSEALKFLEGIPGKKLKGQWQARLKFIAAYLHLKAQEYGKAAELFQEIRDQYPVLRDYIDYYLAIAWRESGKVQESIRLFSELAARVLPPRLAQGTARELSLAYCKAGDRGTAVDRLNALIQNETSPAKTYRLRFDRASCLLALGDKAEAFALLKNLYLNYPEGDLNAEILAALQQADSAFRLSAADHVERAETLLRKGRPDLAAVDLEAALAMQNPPNLSLRKKLAEAYFKARRYADAARLLAELGDPEDLPDLAKAYARSDQFEAATGVYRELSQRPGANLPDIQFKLAFLKMDEGKLEEANAQFTALLQAYPQHPKRDAVDWYLAWNNYRLGRLEDADAGFARVQERANAKNAKRAAYWRARVLERQGRHAEAKAAFEAIVREDPYSYYGFLSQKRLEGSSDPAAPPKKGVAHELPRLAIPAPFSLSSLENEGGKEPMRRLRELLLVGLWEDFLAELDFVAAREGVEEEFRQIQFASANGGAAVSEAEDEGGGRWNAKYPPAYATLVSLFSQVRNFPMPLAWAIMREESHFRPQVVSAAEAIGLMQIIPPTGYEIARELGRSGFTPEDLYRPVVNIEYGIQYLAMNQRRFGGKLIPTIASYNAGPEAAERWLKARPQLDWEEFAEEIPYAETQDYVRKVLRSYYLYSLLYGNPT
ncbi:MAG: transglycosylase SLT domain-containing protein [bacterium]